MSDLGDECRSRCEMSDKLLEHVWEISQMRNTVENESRLTCQDVRYLLPESSEF